MLCDLLVGDSPLLLLPPTGGSLLKVASLGVPPESQVIGGGLPDVRVHGVEILEILDMHKIVWQMALGFVARNLGGLLEDKVVLVVEATEAFVVCGIDGIGPSIFLLVGKNVIILTLSGQFLVVRGVWSVWISCSALFLRDSEALEGLLKFLEVEVRLSSRGAFGQLRPRPSLVGTHQGRGHSHDGELLLLPWIPERIGRLRSTCGYFLPRAGRLLILSVFLRHDGLPA